MPPPVPKDDGLTDVVTDKAAGPGHEEHLKAAREKRLEYELQFADSKWPVLSHHSKFRVAWDLTMIFCVGFTALMTPLSLAYDWTPEGSVYALQVFVDSYFWVDILLNFRTSYTREIDGARLTSAAALIPRVLA